MSFWTFWKAKHDSGHQLRRKTKENGQRSTSHALLALAELDGKCKSCGQCSGHTTVLHHKLRQKTRQFPFEVANSSVLKKIRKMIITDHKKRWLVNWGFGSIEDSVARRRKTHSQAQSSAAKVFRVTSKCLAFQRPRPDRSVRATRFPTIGIQLKYTHSLKRLNHRETLQDFLFCELF